MLGISIVTGTEEELSEEHKRRFEFINIIEGIIKPEESFLRNKDFYKKTGMEKYLTFSASYLWEDSVVPWEKILKMPPEKMISAGAEISRVQRDYLEGLKELIYGIKREYVLLNGPDKIRVNGYVLEKLLELGQEYDWRNPLELLEFDRRYMLLKEKNKIISYRELSRYYSWMFSRRDELAAMQNRSAKKQMDDSLKGIEMLIEQAI